MAGLKLTSLVSCLGLTALWGFQLSNCGSTCPPFESIRPCYCFITEDSHTIVICAGMENSTELLQATNDMKGMIIDRFVLLNAFKNYDASKAMEENELEFSDSGQKLPPKWLSSVRVRQIDIQDAYLSNCFLCDDPFDGQSDFLTSLEATRSSLEGNLCSVCNTKTKSVSTRGLQISTNLKQVDFSHNDLEVISGYAFPSTLENLKKVALSNNKIARIHDNAFANLNQLTELDLSRNQLTVLSRKAFRTSESSLRTLDLSWNSIQFLSEDMFTNLRNLKEIRMSNNLLEVLPSNTFSRVPALLEKVDVRGNFLVCNCSLSWISKKLSRNTKLVGKCIAPKEVEFQDVKSTLATIQNCPE